MNSGGLVLASLLLTRPGHCPGKQNVCPASPAQPSPAQPSPAQQQAPAGPVHTAGLAWLEQHVWTVATLALSTQKCTLYFNILHTSFFL